MALASERDRTASRSAEPAQLTRVGTFWSAYGASGHTDPFRSSGSYVAAAAWTRALVEHAAIPRIDVFASGFDVELCRAQFQGAPAAATDDSEGLGVLSEYDLPRHLQAHRYDVLHDPEDLDFTRPSYARSRLSQRLFPITCSQHGISSSTQLYSCFVRMLTAQIYPCDAIVCLTPASRVAMERRLRDIAQRYSRAWNREPPRLPRLEAIPWGIDTRRFAPGEQEKARRDLDLPLGRPVVLCVGRVRIEDKMDWTPLLLAFERVQRTVRQPPLFLLAGANPTEYGERIIEQGAQLGLRDNLRTFYNLPPACLPLLYAACDIFVSPVDTPSESFGLTITEAMASGRAVVASDWDGYKELIVHGETGFRVRTHWADCLGELNQLAPFLRWDHEHLHVGQSVSVDVAQMTGYLVQLLENPELRSEMGRRGRVRAEALYDWRVVIPQWEALWAELAAVARSIQVKEPDQLDFVQPNYFQHFSHYASSIVDEATSVQLTRRGKELLAGDAPLFLHPWSQAFLRPEHLRAALQVLKPTGWLDAGLPVGDLLGALRKTRGLTRDQAMMHLMWLAKYDLVSLSGERELLR